MEPSTSLIDAYNLKEKAEEIASTSFNEKKAHISKQSSKESQVVLLNESLQLTTLCVFKLSAFVSSKRWVL